VRRLPVLVAALVALALAASPALAHVDVLPVEIAQGGATQFTIRVPAERDLPTTRVAVDFPSQVTVYSFADPPPGWTVTPVRAADGRFSGVVYSGGRIGVDRYADFHVLGTPFESGEAVWKARQTYADGQVKPWTGPPELPGQEAPESGPGDPGPAALVTVLEPGAAASAATPAAAGESDSGAAIWLGVIAIVISGLCLLALGFLWSTRPARLPPDDTGS
jgi:Domain of unkown function (DUF1775)